MKITDAQITEWKRIHGQDEVFKIIVCNFDPTNIPSPELDESEIKLPNDEQESLLKAKQEVYQNLIQELKAKEAIGYVRCPSIKELSDALDYSNRDIMQGEFLLKMCWLGGDERIMNQKLYTFPAAIQMLNVFQVFNSNLEKI